MTLKNDRYTYRVTWSEDDNEYVGLCAEFPSLSWLAKNPEAALKGIRKLVEEVIKDMNNEGEVAPKPIQPIAYSVG
jgi:predicted RNase H-like HicB family nuclease